MFEETNLVFKWQPLSATRPAVDPVQLRKLDLIVLHSSYQPSINGHSPRPPSPREKSATTPSNSGAKKFLQCGYIVSTAWAMFEYSGAHLVC